MSSTGGATRENIKVTVRLRPFSERERARGDRAVWQTTAPNTLGLAQGVGRIQYSFDRVLEQQSNNREVYGVACGDVVSSALDGYNGTIFAYGVTSSGKTHTILGHDEDPGIVQLALEEIFNTIKRSKGRDFLLGLSMLEIYNEDLKDLLDPSRTLKLREDDKKGFFVEGAKEEILLSPKHALAALETGRKHRTVSSTTYNDASSRSHTIMRLRLESSTTAANSTAPLSNVNNAATPRGGMPTRSLSYLNLIDLAGSESAKVVKSQGHSREGSYINRSLLTLSTVIGKLSDGNAQHIPYRDSKLTRLLQNSLSGAGAKIAIIATITPASSQAEETHNTLKFATRAKKIEVQARRNEATDTSSLLIRAELEIAQLKSQLEALQRSPRPQTVHDPLHPEVRNLRERLEEEHIALLAKEADKATLERRISGLTRLVLTSTRANASAALRGDGRAYNRAVSDLGVSTYRASLQFEEASSRGPSLTNPQPKDNMRSSLHSGLGSVRSVGELIPSHGLLQQQGSTGVSDMEREALCDQVIALSDELEARAKQMESMKRVLQPRGSGSGGNASAFGHNSHAALARNLSSDFSSLQAETDLQLLAAERDFLAGQLKSAAVARHVLQAHVQALQKQLQEAGMQPCATVLPAPSPALLDVTTHSARLMSHPGRDGDGDSDFGDSMRGFALLRSPLDSTEGSVGSRTPPVGQGSLSLGRSLTTNVIEQLGRMEGQVAEAVREAESRDAVMGRQRQALAQAQAELDSLRRSTRALQKENVDLKAEAARLEVKGSQMQGYGLDDMANTQLSGLIATLTQAVERVKVTVQLRRVQQAARKGTSSPPLSAYVSETADLDRKLAEAGGRLDEAGGKLAEAVEELAASDESASDAGTSPSGVATPADSSRAQPQSDAAQPSRAQLPVLDYTPDNGHSGPSTGAAAARSSPQRQRRAGDAAQPSHQTSSPATPAQPLEPPRQAHSNSPARSSHFTAAASTRTHDDAARSRDESAPRSSHFIVTGSHDDSPPLSHQISDLSYDGASTPSAGHQTPLLMTPDRQGGAKLGSEGQQGGSKTPTDSQGGVSRRTSTSPREGNLLNVWKERDA
ncbi:hypothetical protein WJX73_005189 [Symbiochloris irregularis]|uniref:Kinesin motor domain-containing protein n=1 Tax=Symbiochloris irregularis TaxID=706552 RepID=A0AAW1PWG8_9CHLO